jgi:hypothetical protein
MCIRVIHQRMLGVLGKGKWPEERNQTQQPELYKTVSTMRGRRPTSHRLGTKTLGLGQIIRILVYTIICIFVYSCISRTTCWKTIKGGQCVPIKSYEEWNKCVTPCEVTLNSKTKPYKPKTWIRPRPYVYP